MIGKKLLIGWLFLTGFSPEGSWQMPVIELSTQIFPRLLAHEFAHQSLLQRWWRRRRPQLRRVFRNPKKTEVYRLWVFFCTWNLKSEIRWWFLVWSFYIFLKCFYVSRMLEALQTLRTLQCSNCRSEAWCFFGGILGPCCRWSIMKL